MGEAPETAAVRKDWRPDRRVMPSRASLIAKGQQQIEGPGRVWVGARRGGRGLPSVTCPVPAEFKKFLLYARQMEIRGVDLDAPYYNYIISFTVPDIDNVTVLDYDAREQRVYWSDVRTQAIKRAFINGTGVETVVSAGSVQASPPGSLAPVVLSPNPFPQSVPIPMS